MPNFFSCAAIHKNFGKHVVFHEYNHDIQANGVTLLIGANGVGKSTLLSMLAGIISPEKGKIHKSTQLKIGYLGQDLQLYRYLTVSENLKLYAKLAENQPALTNIIEQWNLGPYQNTIINNLSRGWQQRVSLARIFLQNAEYLILDEPSSHLDQQSISLLKNMLASQTLQGAFIASHDLHNFLDCSTELHLLRENSVNYFSKADYDSAIIEYQRNNR